MSLKLKIIFEIIFFALVVVVVHVVAAAVVAVVAALFISRFKNSGTKVRKTMKECVDPSLVKFLTSSNVFDKKHFYLLKRVH
jgi:hypothetical protein